MNSASYSMYVNSQYLTDYPIKNVCCQPHFSQVFYSGHKINDPV